MEDEDGDKDRMQQVWKLHTCRRSVLPPPGAVLPATPPPSSFPSVEDQLRAGQSLVLPRTGPREEGGGAHPFRLREKVPVEGSSDCLPWGSPRVTDTSTDTQTDRRTEMERLRSCGRPRCVQGCLRRRGWSGLLRPHHGRLERQAQEPRQ